MWYSVAKYVSAIKIWSFYNCEVCKLRLKLSNYSLVQIEMLLLHYSYLGIDLSQLDIV